MPGRYVKGPLAGSTLEPCTSASPARVTACVRGAQRGARGEWGRPSALVLLDPLHLAHVVAAVEAVGEGEAELADALDLAQLARVERHGLLPHVAVSARETDHVPGLDQLAVRVEQRRVHLGRVVPNDEAVHRVALPIRLRPDCARARAGSGPGPGVGSARTRTGARHRPFSSTMKSVLMILSPGRIVLSFFHCLGDGSDGSESGGRAAVQHAARQRPASPPRAGIERASVEWGSVHAVVRLAGGWAATCLQFARSTSAHACIAGRAARHRGAQRRKARGRGAAGPRGRAGRLTALSAPGPTLLAGRDTCCFEDMAAPRPSTVHLAASRGNLEKCKNAKNYF